LLLILLQFVDTGILYTSSVYLYIFGVLIVVLLHFTPASIAEPVTAPQRWFNRIPSITIHPPQITKIAIIVILGMLVVKHKEKFKVATATSDLWLIAKILLFTALPVAFIAVQTDLGTAIVFMFIAGIIILLSGIDWKILSLILVTGISAVVLAVFLVVNFPEIATEKLGIQP